MNSEYTIYLAYRKRGRTQEQRFGSFVAEIDKSGFSEILAKLLSDLTVSNLDLDGHRYSARARKRRAAANSISAARGNTCGNELGAKIARKRDSDQFWRDQEIRSENFLRQSERETSFRTSNGTIYRA